MRILASSDLHYNIKRSKGPAQDLAQRVLRRGGDVFILAGDIAGIEPEMFQRGLELFSGFTGKKLLVAGNHDLWVKPGQCSFEKWSKLLPALAREAGFEMLDHQPCVIGNIGFVGNIGWYDYSFRDEDLRIPLRFYEAKIGPGRAWRLEEWHHLLDKEYPLPPEHQDITTAWRDGEFVKLPMSDTEFVEHLAQKLRADLSAVAASCEKIVSVIHHVPRRDLVWYRGDSNWDFAAAFLGSRRFQEILSSSFNLNLSDFPALPLCLAGHNHHAKVVKENATEYITIGSTYVEKVLLEFELC